MFRKAHACQTCHLSGQIAWNIIVAIIFYASIPGVPAVKELE